NSKPINSLTYTIMSNSTITNKENKPLSRLRIIEQFEVAISTMLIAFSGLLIAHQLLDAIYFCKFHTNCRRFVPLFPAGPSKWWRFGEFGTIMPGKTQREAN